MLKLGAVNISDLMLNILLMEWCGDQEWQQDEKGFQKLFIVSYNHRIARFFDVDLKTKVDFVM